MESINPITEAAMGRPKVEAFREARSEQAFKEFEGLFLKELLKEMRKSVPDEGIFKRSHATKMYEEMLDEVFSQAMAGSGQFGIAKQVAAQVLLREERAGARPEALQNQGDDRQEALKGMARVADKSY